MDDIGTMAVTVPIEIFVLLITAKDNLVESNLPEGFVILSIHDDRDLRFSPEDIKLPTKIIMIIGHKDFALIDQGEMSPTFDFQWKTYGEADGTDNG